jgi:acetoin utilization deacetylase AcuC-like enzyme
MSKFARAAELVSAFADVQDPGLIGDDDLLRVHSIEYVGSIRNGMYNERTSLRLGLPWSPELSTRAHCATAGTLAAARWGLREGLAANLAGGTHHAFADHGEGYCVFNDVAVAIRALWVDDPLYQFLVVDLDAHQGNGTHHIFADEPRVFTYSVHGGRNYPSIKVPGSQDVELPRYVPGEDYLHALRTTLPPAIERAEPDLAFFIAGVDVHEEDRFGQMCLSTLQMAQRDQFTIDLLRHWGIPTVVVFGGGYHRRPEMTARLHAQSIHIAASRFARERGLEPPHPFDPDAEPGVSTPGNLA